MTYLLVIDHIATGGAERILIDYHNHLKKQGHQVFIFVLTGKDGESVWTKGLEITYGSQNDTDNLLLKTRQQILLYHKLKKIVLELNPDVIFSFLEKSNLLTLAIPSKAQKIVTVHNILSIQYLKVKQQFIRNIVFFLIRRAYNKCNKVIAVSQQVKKDLTDQLHINKENITVINNYVDAKALQEKGNEIPDNFSFQTNKKYIINIGRFSDQKAQWKLVKAFSISQAINKEWELILMGQGEHKDRLEKLTSELGIQQKVHILPFNPNPYPYLKRANLVVLSSLFEGFPIVIAESSSLRIPFIGSEKAIPEEIFTDHDFWKKCVFKIKTFTPEFNLEIQDDEKDLCNLIDIYTESEQKRINILEQTSNWEKHNDKNFQFKLYDQMTEKKS